MADSRLFLLDGMALVYRAHFAFIRNPITNSQGVNTSAIFGFTNTLLTILEKENPTHLAVAFDTSEPTPRHKLYPEYKAQREEMPEELAAAIPEVKKLCAAFKIPVLVIDGYEADDIIGTVARRAEEAGNIETFMVTPDKDFAQLVAPHTAMWKPGRQGSDHEVLDLPKTLEKWGVESPKQVIDILGLWGDASDNIPGVPGIGEKTAKKLVAQFGSVEGLLENVDQLKGKQKENVTNFAEQARLSKELATIITDVPVKDTFADFEIEKPDEAALRALFETWEFRTLTKRLFGDQTSPVGSSAPPVFQSLKTIKEIPHHYHHLTSPAEVDELLARLKNAGHFCFDVETNSLDRFSSRLLGIAFSLEPHEAYYLPITDWPAQREKLLPILTSPALKIGHNLKFDLAILRSHEVVVEGPFFDTMLAHTLVAPDQKHSMDALAENLLGYSPVKLADLFAGKDADDDLFAAAAKKKAAKGEIDPSELDPEILAEYAAEDADVTLQLYHALLPKLKELKLLHVMEDIEAPLLPVLVAMEAEGITLDQAILDEVDGVLSEKIKGLAKGIEKAAGRSFNLNSPKQLGEILFGEMQLVEKPKKTKTGQFKTDEQTLSTLAPKHPIVADILSYREATKLKSTYVDALPAHRSQHSGRVHTHLHQLVTSTGRLASSDPNLQNIPVRSEVGRELRRAFVARGPEFTLMAADYSQVELRVMAALSGDPAMIEAFRNDLDIHTATAARVFGVAIDDVLPEMRRTAKMVNFGIIYGISAFGLSQRLGIPRAEADEIIETYFEEYPAIQQFMDQTVESVRECGFAQTLAGRRRYFKDIKSGNANVRNNAERAAINSPIQGTAADMIKLAMTRIHSLMQGRKSCMILQVHDELLFDLHRDEREELPKLITDAMTEALPLPHDVPVKIDVGFGDNWLKAH